MRELRKYWPITLILLGVSLIGTCTAFQDYYTELAIRNTTNGFHYPTWPWPWQLFVVLFIQMGMVVIATAAFRKH